MDRQVSITVDNLQINHRLIQSAFDSAKYQNKTNEVLSEIFRMINLSKIHEANPSDRNTKDMIKNIVNSQFLPQTFEAEPFKNRLDLSQAFPLNKLGNFGRQLQRKCRLTEKGLMQFEDNKPPKPKEIRTFVNRIEHFGDKNNDNKIGWISDEKKYPFRIIVVDKSDGHKGIYFSNQDKAEVVRIFLSQNLKYTGNSGKLFSSLNQHFVDQSLGAFKNKLIFRKRMINKTNRFSRNLVIEEKEKSRNSNDSHIKSIHEHQNTSVFYNEVVNISNRGTELKDPNAEMLKFSRLLETKSNREQAINLKPALVRELQTGYIINFLESWHEKARAIKLAEKKKAQNQKPPFSNNFIGSSNMQGTRNNQFDRKSAYGGSILNESRKRVEVNPRQKDNQSIFRGLQASSIKESYVKEFSKEVGSPQTLFCYSIQFLTLTNLFFKPIVTIQMSRKNNIEQRIIYNTIIVRKEPHLTYQLLSSDEDSFSLHYNLREYEIIIKVIDFLANEEVINDRITMQTKKIVDKAVLTTNNKLVKLELGVRVNELIQTQVKPLTNSQVKKNVVELNVPPLSEEVKAKIDAFWEKQSQFQGYYNESNLTIYRILSQIQSPPLSWWKGIKEDDYEIYQIFNNASKILGFKMIRSFKHILQAFEKMYPDLQQMVVKALSFILTFLKPYYFPEYLNKIQKFHRVIGLQQDCEFISKVNLEVIAIQKIVQFECPTLSDKLSRKNITYGYQLMQYIYEAFSRNYSVGCLIQLWNYLYTQLDILQLNMVLASIALIKYYEQDLMKAKRFKDFCMIMQSQKISKTQHIIKEMIGLKQKYFAEVKGGLLDEIKNIFNTKPLEPILFEFYKRETAKIDKRKTSKEIEKKSVMRKVNKQVEIDLPTYECKKYCLHIYFRRLPNVGGSLTIRSNEIGYECLNHEKNRYFIIGEVSSRVNLIFLDLKSNEYSCQLEFNQGINEFTTTLTSPRSSVAYKVSYIAGLLTDNQLQIFKRAKKFDHFLSPFVKQLEFFQQMNRPVQQTDFLKKYDNNSSRDDLVKKIKVLFGSGTRAFNEIQFYIEQIETSDLTIEEKIYFVKNYAAQLSNEFSLCSNKIYEKHFFKIFLEKSGFQFTDNQFECFYSDSLENEFDSPKLIKCRYIPGNQPSKELKLEGEALDYFISKSSNYLYGDVIIEDLISYLKPFITDQLGSFLQGELKLLFSTSGQIYIKTWLLKLKNKNKQIEYEQLKEDTVDDIEQVEMNEPEILMTEVLPSFAKISTILDYVNTNRNIDLKTKYQDKDRKKMVENINVIKDCQPKFNRIIAMRYNIYPETINIPFFLYYYELVKDHVIPNIKGIYLNNLKSDIKSLCLLKGTLKFGENAKVEAYTYQQEIGLYGNLRQLSRDSKVWFFFSYGSEEYETKFEQARVFANYGYGVFRWEPCFVLGFVNRIKSRGNSKTSSKGQPKKEYMIVVRGQEKYVKEYELQLKPGALSRIQQIQESGPRVNRLDRSYFDDDEDRNKEGSLKYLSKFIR